MSPIEMAEAVYRREACNSTFEEDLLRHFQYGYVISTPDLFCLAREAHHSDPRRWQAGPPAPLSSENTGFGNDRVNPGESQCKATVKREEKLDTWYISLFAGELKKVFSFCPNEKEYVAFERHNVLKCYRFEAIRKILLKP